MCVAVFKPKNAVIPMDRLETCFDNNPDGAGFMYTEGGHLHVQKGFFTFEDFWNAYEPHQKKKAVLHFRIKTHGAIDAENCHPYQVDDNMAFVHNGIISKVNDASDRSKSDTWHFNEQFVKPLRGMNPRFIRNEAVQKLFKEYIGYSKLVFMNQRGEVTIVNEKMGEWADGVWFSNGSYKPYGRTRVSAITQPAKEYLPPVKSGGSPLVQKSTGSGGSVIVHPTTTNIEVGDIVALKYGYRGLDKGTIGEVMWFKQHSMVDILVGDTEHTVPYWSLELLDVEEMAHYLSAEAGYYGDSWE